MNKKQVSRYREKPVEDCWRDLCLILCRVAYKEATTSPERCEAELLFLQEVLPPSAYERVVEKVSHELERMVSSTRGN